MKYKNIQLKDVADIVMGQSPKSVFYNTNGNGIPFLQGVRTFGENYPQIDTWTTSYNRKAKSGEILFSVRAPVGRVNWANQDLAVGRGLAALKIKSGYSKEYLYYLFKKIGGQLDSLATGTVFTSINKKELEALELKIPVNLSDQEKIADYLQKFDQEIELNNQINDNLMKLNTLLFQQLSVDSDYTLSNFTDCQNGFAFKSSEYITNNELLILRTLNMTSDHLFSKNGVKYISKVYKEKYQKFEFKKFDTTLVMVGASIGKMALITTNVIPSLQNQNMWRFRSKSKMPGLLIYDMVQYVNDRVRSSATGSARSFYRKKMFLNSKVPVISEKYYDIFLAIQEKINNIANENETLSNLKNVLLSKYF